MEEIRPHECYAEPGDLLEAADGMEMLNVADLVKEATASSRLENGGVANLRIEQNFWTCGPQSSQQERTISGRLRILWVLSALDHGVRIQGNMDVIGDRRVCALAADAASFRKTVCGYGLSARRFNGFFPRGRERLGTK